MKTAAYLIITILGLMVIPLHLYMTYVLYRHVGAPEQLWALWVVSIPLTATVQILTEVAKKMKD